MAENQIGNTPAKKIRVKTHVDSPIAQKTIEQTETQLHEEELYAYLNKAYRNWSSAGLLMLIVGVALFLILFALLGNKLDFVSFLLIILGTGIAAIPARKYSKVLRPYGVTSYNTKTAYTQIEKAAFGEVTGISEELMKPAPKPLPSAKGTLLHLEGLGLPDGAKCKVNFQNGILTVNALSQTITLSGEKIINAEIVKKKDISKQAVSNAGGAIAGYTMFGVLGGIVGGAAHTKTVKQVHRFLVISYMSDDEIKYMVFGANDGVMSADKTNALRSAITKYAKGRHVEIEL